MMSSTSLSSLCSPGSYAPAKWLPGGHLQTIWPALLASRPNPQLWHQRLELPDGDFLDLAWSTPDYRSTDPLVVLFHGLEGSARSPYIRGMITALAKQGVQSVVMHFRGCGPEPNRLPRAYHSGETNDTRTLLQYLRHHHQPRALFAIGYSLGGNMLAKYLADFAEHPLLDAAAVVSAPLDLAGCADYIRHGFSRVYQRHLLTSMKRRLRQKMALLPDFNWGFTEQLVDSFTHFRMFDDHVTAPLHGFTDADDYYRQASALPLLPHISVPTLMIHAADDPFMSPSVIPTQDLLNEHVCYELCERGGHVGFVEGPWWRPRFYLERRIPEWLTSVSHRLGFEQRLIK